MNLENITIATSNAGKIKEIQALLNPIKCISQETFNISPVAETGLSFVENAIIKARHASLISQNPALADDSGLVIPILDGKPGILSARFAHENATDQENILHLLKKMQNIPFEKRNAFFYCAIVFVSHANDPTPLIATAKLHGIIAQEPIGSNGFGYDPIFFLKEKNCMMAELDLLEKNKISHRSQALNQLFPQILSLKNPT